MMCFDHAMHQFLRACRNELSKRRGRPRRTSEESATRLHRLIKHPAFDDRESRRIASALRRNNKIEAWLTRMKAAGKTLLTFAEPPPK